MVEIKIIGNNCPYCIKLEKLCREVVAENQIEATIEKITDLNEFGKYGVMLIPGLVLNGRLLTQGKLPLKHTLVHWLTNPQNPSK
ncbi:MAG: thioredoxin family protein [Bacteroidales bacterium]